MIRIFRKFASTAVILVFLLSAANIPLYLHLSQEHSNHDNKKCPICQQAAINKNNAVITINTAVIDLPQVFFAETFESETVVFGFDFLVPYLRAPPAIV